MHDALENLFHLQLLNSRLVCQQNLPLCYYHQNVRNGVSELVGKYLQIPWIPFDVTGLAPLMTDIVIMCLEGDSILYF